MFAINQYMIFIRLYSLVPHSTHRLYYSGFLKSRLESNALLGIGTSKAYQTNSCKGYLSRVYHHVGAVCDDNQPDHTAISAT